MANKGPNMNGSAFFISLADLKDGQMLHKRHTIFGIVAEGLDTTLKKINNAYVDPKNNRPYQNIRIKHTLIIDDPFSDPKGLVEPSRSPSPVVVKRGDNYLDDDVDINEMMKNKTE